MATINVDTRASGRKQGPKRQRKAKENVDFVLPMPSSFLGMETTSSDATSSSTSSATLGATSSATAPVSQTAIQQSFNATSLPSTLALSNPSNAWNASAFATQFSSQRPQTQSLLNNLASHSYQASTNQLLYHGTDPQPQHQAFPLTSEVSHVATAMGGACQNHPFGYPGPLQQSFTTSMFTQRLPPAMSSTQQHSFSGMRPLQPSVPQGFPLPPKPIIPESSNPFFLMKLKGNISKCNGCEGSFQKDSQSVNSMAVIGRLEVDWYPNLYLDGTKCWKLGRAQRRYYHINMACLRTRRPWFHTGHLQGLLRRTEGGLSLTEELIAFVKQCFPGIVVE